jgi:glycosyltransferase involved in cell wall biosynthesis
VRVAIAHDYLTQPGGAERVVLAMLRALPGARLVTSVYDAAGTFPEFARYPVETSPLQRVGTLRRDPRRAFPLLAPAWSATRVEGVDVVLASSSGWAHGVRCAAPVVVYCHNPARWLYQPADYLAGQPSYVRPALAALGPALRRWDAAAAHRAARYLVNSQAVARRVSAAYGIDAQVLNPPVMVEPEGDQQAVGVEPGFLLCVARGRGYKNVAAIRDAVEMLLPDERLVVVGDAQPGRRTTVLGRVTDAELRWLYSQAGALVSVAHEDFGLTPLEANAFGTPALLLRAGGFLETLADGISGLFVEGERPEDVAHAVRRLRHRDWDGSRVREHAAGFGEPAFATRLREALVDAVGRGRAAQ